MGWTTFLFVGAVEEEDCTDEKREKIKTAASSYFLPPPDVIYFPFQTGRRRRFLFLMMGLNQQRLASSSLIIHQMKSCLLDNLDNSIWILTPRVPQFFHRLGPSSLITRRPTHKTWTGHKDDRILPLHIAITTTNNVLCCCTIQSKCSVTQLEQLLINTQ